MPARLAPLAGCCAVLAACAAGCTATGASHARRSGHRAAAVTTAPRKTGVRFKDIADAAGLRYRWHIAGPRPINVLQTIGNGCAFLDYDQDGSLDVLLVGPKLALFRGDGHGHFTDVTHESGLDRLSGHFLGCAVGDYDNDGYPDIYVSGYHTGVLLHNEAATSSGGAAPPGEQPSGTTPAPPGGGAARRIFRDVTREAGLKPQPWGTSCAWVDVDGDGFLDLYICNYVSFDPRKDMVLCREKGILTSCSPLDYDPVQGVLFHNERNGRFANATRAWNARVTGKALGVAPADYDMSGHVSLAIANDLMDADLLHNDGKRFRDVARQSGMSRDDDGDVYAGMGIDWGDYDNDGRLDLFITTFEDQTKCLFHNDGYGTFHIASEQAGIVNPALPYVAWGCKFLDADNDGWLDLMVANGHVQDNVARFEPRQFRQPIQFFHNRGGRPARFEDASASSGLRAVPRLVGRGLAAGDFENNGRVGALITDAEGAPRLLRNETVSSAHWIGLRLLGGPNSARDAYGALVTVRAGGERFLRQCQASGSYMSSSDPRVEVGLADRRLESVTVLWPDHVAHTWTDLQPDRYYTLREADPGQH